MIQDIQPHVYHSEYRQRVPKDGDFLILQKGGELLLSDSVPTEDAAGVQEAESGSAREHGSGGAQSVMGLPTVGQIRRICPQAADEAFYLFSIDDQGYFAAPSQALSEDLLSSASFGSVQAHFFWKNVMTLREIAQGLYSFGGAVGWQLARWYELHRFCGRCGRKTIHSEKERAIICPACGHTYYPRISPVVIIAIVDGDRILLTRYNRGGYRRHALVAGFVEIGETFEDAVRREVMEEVGLRVKNIRYIESQPWPFSSSLIAGFCADVDGDPSVHLNTDGGEELAEAVWFDRKDVEDEDNNISLTWDMIRRFREGALMENAQ